MLNAIERIIALIILILLLPIIILVSILIKLDSKGPIIFKQERVGKYGEIFEIYKFRSMRMSAPRNVATIDLEDNDKHISKLGKFIRKSSIDEIPQLINVIKGDMSFVGPRPVIPNEFELVRLRKINGVYDVRPGITGLAQINGRDLISSDLKVKYDIDYVVKKSLKLDIYILFKTIYKVLKRDDIVDGNIDKLDNSNVDDKTNLIIYNVNQ